MRNELTQKQLSDNAAKVLARIQKREKIEEYVPSPPPLPPKRVLCEDVSGIQKGIKRYKAKVLKLKPGNRRESKI